MKKLSAIWVAALLVLAPVVTLAQTQPAPVIVDPNGVPQPTNPSSIVVAPAGGGPGFGTVVAPDQPFPVTCVTGCSGGGGGGAVTAASGAFATGAIVDIGTAVSPAVGTSNYILGQVLAAAQSPLAAGTAQIGHVVIDTGSSTIGTVTLAANQSINEAQINGVAPLMGNGVSGTGAQRVVIASDNTPFTVNVGTSGLPSGAATSALQTTGNSSLASIVTNLGSPFQAGGSIGNTAFALNAGETHAGEVGGNQITVQIAQTVTASSAYTSGNAIGGLMTVTGAARISGSAGAPGTSGLLQSMVENVKSLQTTQTDVFLFSSNPTGSTCTDKTAFSLVAADFDKVIAVASIPSTGWYAGGTASVGQAINLAIPYALASATTIYACAVTRGTPTFIATSDVSFAFRFIRN